MGDNNDDNNNHNYNDDDVYNSNNESVDICRVYDKNDFFTVAVQIALAIAALLSLYIKRMQETPRRTFSTWCLDIGKQAVGACYAHVLNMIIAAIISKNIRTGEDIVTLDDECAWYGISYLIDTTLGLVLAVIGLRILDNLAHERDWTHLKHSGVYTGKYALLQWSIQCLAWLWILTVVKVIIYIFMWLCSRPLAVMGQILFAPFTGYKHIELLFVMILFPGVLNIIYFWIADGYLKAKGEHCAAHESSTTCDDKAENLLQDVVETEMSAYNTTLPPWLMMANSKQEAATATTSSSKDNNNNNETTKKTSSSSLNETI